MTNKKEFFNVLRVCREDIINEGLMRKKSAESLTDYEMEYIADKMSDALMEDYWEALKMAVELVKEQRRK